MILSEKYLAQFERSSGLKKGTVGNLNHLYETYMSDARQEGSIYKFFVVMDLNGESKIIGGNDYKEDAIDAANEYLESGIRLKVYSGKFLIGKGVNPEDDSNWGNQDDINLAMQAAGGSGNAPMGSLQETEVQQEGVAGVPSQQDVDAFQASEYEGNDEPENDKDAESQDALHLGEEESDEDSMLGEIDNMMGGNDAPSAPDTSGSSMGSGDEWMDEPNANQMNSLGGGTDDVELAENNYGTRAGVAAKQNQNADDRKTILPQVPPHAMAGAIDTLKHSQSGTTIQRKSGQNFGQFKALPEQALSLNEDSKALYAKAKVSEAEYERFLRNAGIKK